MNENRRGCGWIRTSTSPDPSTSALSLSNPEKRHVARGDTEPEEGAGPRYEAGAERRVTW